METLRNEPVILTGNGSFGGGGFGGFGGGGCCPPVISHSYPAPYGPAYGGYGGGFGFGHSPLDSIVALSLLRDVGHGHRHQCCDKDRKECCGDNSFKHTDVATFQQLNSLSKEVCEVGHKVGESESRLQSSICNVRADIKEGTQHILNRLCDAEKECIKSGYENRIKMDDIKSSIIGKIDSEVGAVRGQIANLNTSINHQFCELNHRLDKDFRQISEDRLRDELNRLKMENDNLREDRRADASERKIVKEIEKAICDRTIIVPTVHQTACPPVPIVPSDCKPKC